MLQELAAGVRAASSVAVVGGGPLGVELAGEIVTVSWHGQDGTATGSCVWPGWYSNWRMLMHACCWQLLVLNCRGDVVAAEALPADLLSVLAVSPG